MLPSLTDYLSATALASGADEAQRSATAIQRRALRLVGTLGGDALFLVNKPPSTDDRSASTQVVMWSRKPVLSFDMPFRDYKASIHLGSFNCCNSLS